MSEQPETPATPGADESAGLAPVDKPSGGSGSPVPGVLPDPVGPATKASDAPAWTPPAPPRESPGASGASGVAAVATDRPEVAVGAAFAGGLVFALILKRLAR